MEVQKFELNWKGYVTYRTFFEKNLQKDVNWRESVNNDDGVLILKLYFSRLLKSIFSHERTRIAGSNEHFIAVGSYFHANSELYYTDTQLWDPIDDYPGASSIYNAPIISYGDSYVLFGGYQSGYGEMEDIVKFSGGSWLILGYLNNERRG